MDGPASQDKLLRPWANEQTSPTHDLSQLMPETETAGNWGGASRALIQAVSKAAHSKWGTSLEHEHRGLKSQRKERRLDEWANQQRTAGRNGWTEGAAYQ